MDTQAVMAAFTEMYGSDGQHQIKAFHSPGRVNIIGEHTDYNGGFVFPCALSFGTYGLVRKRDDNTIKLASLNIPLTVETSIEGLINDKEHGWGNYVKGVVNEFQKIGKQVGGFEMLINGDIPNGAGLSSSASVELLTAVMLNDFFDAGMDMLEMVKLCQRAENTFMGVNCGIMDQFAVGMGKADQAMMLNCLNLEFDYVPFVLKGCKLVIGNTNKKRGLADSKYNERRSQCENAVKQLAEVLKVEFLGQVSPEAFEANKHLITDPVERMRAEHVVYEDNRVIAAVEALKANDINKLGELMVQSHNSLRDLYEVTGAELDTLVEEALKVDGVYGSRMTGAGFGGCTVSIVKEDAVDAFIAQVGENYEKKTGLKADFYIADVGDGARAL